MAQAPPAGLFFDSIEKSFGGTHALRGVSLAVGRGEIVALLGENGAGKSTLIKILGGIHHADSGRVLIDGAPYGHKPGRIDERQPVAFIHQDLGLIEWMTIAENMALAQGFARKAGLIDWRSSETVARVAMARIDCHFDPTTRVQSLTRTEKSLVAIARALAVECDFLVLDEPTASLPADEVERLFTTLRGLRDKGVGMIFVSHRLDEVFRIADRVAVLRDGDMVGVRDARHTDSDELVNLIVGRKTRAVEKLEPGEGNRVLEVRGLAAGALGPVDFEVRRGELLGLVGLRGAGQEEVSRCLFGEIAHAGEVLLDGRPLDSTSPKSAMDAGLGLIARDRVVESIAPALTIRENTFLNPSRVGRKLHSLLGARREARQSVEIGRTVGLSPNEPELPIEALSGGNQQKVVIGRWLATDRRLLIAEDPTAGVDVGAKAEIYALINDALTRGLGVIVVSTDFDEVATICHRALVFSRGQKVADLSGVDLSTESLIQAASASDHKAA